MAEKADVDQPPPPWTGVPIERDPGTGIGSRRRTEQGSGLLTV